MNRVELVAKIAENSGLTKVDADKALDCTLKAIEGALKSGDDIRLIGFGNFEVKTRGERTGRNPKTGEKITIAATKAVVFKAGKALKEAVNG